MPQRRTLSSQQGADHDDPQDHMIKRVSDPKKNIGVEREREIGRDIFERMWTIEIHVGLQLHIFLMMTQCDFRFLVDIHDEEKESFLVGLRQARFISLLIDGATDSGNLEDEIVYVKFVDAKRGPVQRFLGIQDVRHANADGVLATVDIGRQSLIKSTVYFCKTKCMLVREHYCLCF